MQSGDHGEQDAKSCGDWAIQVPVECVLEREVNREGTRMAVRMQVTKRAMHAAVQVERTRPATGVPGTGNRASRASRAVVPWPT